MDNPSYLTQSRSPGETVFISSWLRLAMLKRMRYLANENENFAFETTLASRSFASWIVELKKNGYFFHLTFLLLDSPDLAVSRVAERVKMGGHFVPEETIRRRYMAGIKNFFGLYAPIADSWQMHDNSSIKSPVSIASKINNELTINDSSTWQALVVKYDETSKK